MGLARFARAGLKERSASAEKNAQIFHHRDGNARARRRRGYRYVHGSRPGSAQAAAVWPPERLVTIDEAGTHGKPGLNRGAAYLDVKAWQQQSKTFDEIAYYSDVGSKGNFLDGTTGPTNVHLTNVSTNFFSTLGVQPRLGHAFDEDVDAFTDGKNADTIVLGDAAWRQMYGSDPGILGKDVLLNGQPYVVVGVMPRAFAFAAESSANAVWTAIRLDDADKSQKDRPRSYSAIGRLRAGVPLSAAEAELRILQAQLAKNYTDPSVRESRDSVIVQRYADTLVDASLKKGLIALLAAAAVLWLIACVNVTNLFLVRATTRQREIAVRGALGASRARIMQQLLFEGLILSGTASLLGSLLAMAAIRIFEKQIPAHLPLIISARANITVLLALVGFTLLTTLFSSRGPHFSPCTCLSKPRSSRVGRGVERTARSIGRVESWWLRKLPCRSPCWLVVVCFCAPSMPCGMCRWAFGQITSWSRT
jgi:MacB-like periplasmic core domain/FtsX-like permease family